MSIATAFKGLGSAGGVTSLLGGGGGAAGAAATAAFPWGAAIGTAATVGMGLLGMSQQDQALKEQARQAKAAAREQERQAFEAHLNAIEQNSYALVGEIQRQGDIRAGALYDNAYQNLMIRYGNERTEDIYGKQIDLFKTAAQYQDLAAYEAYAQNERRLQEIFTAANFQMTKDRKNLSKALGSFAAADEGNRGASYELAAEKETTAVFGTETYAELTESLVSAESGMKAENEVIRRQAINQRLSDYSQIAIPPMLQAELPPPQFGAMPTAAPVGRFVGGYQPIRTPSSNNALKIANTGLAGVGQFAKLGGFDDMFNNRTI